MGKQDDKSTLPAVAAPVGGAIAVYDYGDNKGAGFENQTSEDASIPFLTVLQAMSPQVAGAPEKRIKGASAGMLLNTVTNELFDGEAGIIVQPCDTNHVFVEWKPRNQGGGFVAVHQLDSKIVVDARASQQFGEYKNGQNDLVETFYVPVLLHRTADLDEQATLPPEGMLIAFTSTKVRVYRSIITRLRTLKGSPPLFANRLKITTSTETNSSGTFSNFVIKGLVGDNLLASLIPPKLADAVHPMLLNGKALMEAYRGGAVKANHDAAAAASAGGGKDKDIPF